MASVIWILYVVLYAEFMCAVSADKLVSLNCQDENHGVHGKDSLLKCFLNSGGESVMVTAATWRRPGGKRPLLMFINDKVKMPEDPRFSFKQLQVSGRNIDVSFLVRNTMRTDEGKYECEVVTDSGEAKAVVSLSVTATYSKPDMSSVPEKDLQEDMEVTLFCNASGGYPVGMIHWYDQHGTNWTRSAEMTVVETTDKRTNLSSKFTLRASSITPQYRCLVLNNNGVEEGKAEFDLKFRENELVSLDCQDENHGVLGKDSLLKCFLKSGGESVKVTAATWRRPGEKPPIIMFINEKVRMPEDPRFSFKQSQLSGSNIDVSFLVRNTLWTDEGKYECIVEADSGEAKAVVSLSVTATYSKPDMSSVPEKDLQEGMEVTLFCNASGGYPVGMIHWYDQHGTNWTPSAEMTVVETTDKRTNLSSKFTLRASSITPRYRCLVLNNNGVEEGKAEFALKFREKELLSLDCQDENHGVHGKDSLLKCFLNSGGINVTVTAATWRRPGEKPPLIMFINDKVREPEDPRFSFKQLQMSGSNIDVSFLVRDTVRTDEGKYECEVVTDSGEAKAVVSLSVTATYSKPDMSSVPEKDLQEGMEVTLFCNASGGYPVAMIRWYDQHGTDWTPSAEMTVVETTDKHTNLSSKVTLKASSSAPLYRCLVLNNNGVEEGKAEFDLKFRENEFLSLDCQDENHGVYGKESLLKCFLNSGGKNVTVTAASWWRSGEKPPLIMFINDKVREPEDPRFSFKQLQMSGSNIDVSFLVRNTLWTDEGEYECEVVTDSGEAKAVVSLSVTATYSKPDMSSVPEKDLQEGMEVTLFCNASGGYPVGMIHWYDQYGTDCTPSAEMTVVETTDKRTNLSSKFTLKASSSAPLYRCSVLNNNGVEGEAEFDLKFRKKELVSLNCQDENHGVHGKDSLLKCFLNSGGESVRVTAATWRRPGEKRPLIKFRYNKVSVREDPRFSFKQLQWSGSNIDVSFLVRNTVRTDEGKYECKVVTDSGDAKAVVSLSVRATYSKPDMSSVPEKDLQEGMEVTLFCNASGGYPVGMIHWYDQHGTDWTRSAEMTVVETTDKHTNLSSKVTLRASSITPQYRCLVFNNNGVEGGKAEFALKFREKEGDQGSMGSMSSTASTASTAVLVIVIPLLCGLLILALRRQRAQPARRLSTHPILGAMYPEGSDMMEEGFLKKGVQAMQWITISSCSTSSAGLNNGRSMELIPPFF
ncbi:hemicentin-1-like isoform X26 [Anguilla anguilla]|uniref:hemicentin-1-like isoform X26 n=1 Tax=Anguilla anguilla TaxID=7936 RepID=UPI0015B23634|nr:hemicentin-1-like isoform X26 [Anguilla anguilla]